MSKIFVMAALSAAATKISTVAAQSLMSSTGGSSPASTSYLFSSDGDTNQIRATAVVCAGFMALGGLIYLATKRCQPKPSVPGEATPLQQVRSQP